MSLKKRLDVEKYININVENYIIRYKTVLLEQVWLLNRSGRRYFWSLASEIAHILRRNNKSIDLKTMITMDLNSSLLLT